VSPVFKTMPIPRRTAPPASLPTPENYEPAVSVSITVLSNDRYEPKVTKPAICANNSDFDFIQGSDPSFYPITDPSCFPNNNHETNTIGFDFDNVSDNYSRIPLETSNIDTSSLGITQEVEPELEMISSASRSLIPIQARRPHDSRGYRITPLDDISTDFFGVNELGYGRSLFPELIS